MEGRKKGRKNERRKEIKKHTWCINYFLGAIRTETVSLFRQGS